MKFPVKKALILYFVILLLIPGYKVYDYYTTLRFGKPCKIRVTLYDPYDPFRGRYVAIRPEEDDLPAPKYSTSGRRYLYFVLEEEADGFYRIGEGLLEKPASGVYVKNLVLDRYYMNEYDAEKTDHLQTDQLENKELYALLKVKNGKYVLQGVYVDDVLLDDYIKTL